MEAILFNSSAADEKSLSPYKSHMKTRTPKNVKNRPPFIARQTSENSSPILNLQNNGLLQSPPPFPPYHHLSLSYPPFSSSQQQNQQPPLLPLPISTSFITKPNNTNKNTNSLIRGLSCPPANRKASMMRSFRDSSLTPKKTQKTISKKDVNLMMKPLGPETKDLPKNVPKVLSSLSGNNNNTNSVSTTSTNDVVCCLDEIKKDEVGEFSGSVAFTISPPPPSSLPLPTFSLRPKLSCNAEAAGVDAGATDNLRRLLRLV